MSLIEIPSQLGIKERVTDTHVYFLRGPLSQWFHSPFIACDYISKTLGYCAEFHRFANCEQYMMYNKAIFMRDMNMAVQILLTQDPRTVKALGREIKNYDDALWDKVRFLVVAEGNILKFGSSQSNPKLTEYLQSTGDRILVEANPKDGIWGVALDEKDDAILDEANWKGQNLLGKALMIARSKTLPSEFETLTETVRNQIIEPLVEKWRPRKMALPDGL